MKKFLKIVSMLTVSKAGKEFCKSGDYCNLCPDSKNCLIRKTM